MIGPGTQKEAIQHLRDLADAIEQGKIYFRGLQINPKIEVSYMPKDKIREDFDYSLDIRVECKKVNFYELIDGTLLRKD